MSFKVFLLLLIALSLGCIQAQESLGNEQLKNETQKVPPQTSPVQSAKPSLIVPAAPPRPTIEPKLLWKYKTGDDAYSVGVSSNADYVAIGSWDGYVYLLNRSGQLFWKFKMKGSTEDVAISENYVAATSYLIREGTLYLFSISGELLWSKTFSSHLKGVDVGAQGVLVGSGDGSIYLFYRNGTKAWEYKTENSAWGVWDVAFSKGSVVAGGDDASLYLLGMDGKLIWKKNLSRESHIYGVAISEDGEYSAAVSEDKNVYFFKNGELLWKRGTGFSNYGVAISKYIAAGSWDGYFYLFDRSGNLLWKYNIGSYVNRVAFSPEGSYLAAASSDGYAYFFEIG